MSSPHHQQHQTGSYQYHQTTTQLELERYAMTLSD